MHTPRLLRRLSAASRPVATSLAAIALASSFSTGTVSAVPVPAPTTKPSAADSPVPGLPQPTPEVLDRVEMFIQEPGMPDSVRNTLFQLIGFLRNAGHNANNPGIAIPENGPTFAKFGWPTLAPSCIDGSVQAMGTAIAVPGPAALPLPGVPSGHTSFIFTALGTGPATPKQSTTMRVNWMNTSTNDMGQTLLTRGLVNPDGPGTLTGLANTGAGTVIAVLSGGVSTQERTGTMNCEFTPTIGLVNVH